MTIYFTDAHCTASTITYPSASRLAEEIGVAQGTKDHILKAERSQHRVVITQSLLMGATEITVAQFKQFATAPISPSPSTDLERRLG